MHTEETNHHTRMKSAISRLLHPACLSGLLFLPGLLFTETANAAEALKIYVLAGQSNMQGHAHIRTLEHLGMDPETAPLSKRMQDPDGTPRVFEDVWITYLSSEGVKHGKLTAGFGASEDKIGPEFAFGVTVRQRVEGPILLIKTAWGGKSLHTDLRPPSAGAYRFGEDQLARFKEQGKDLESVKADKANATGHHYRLMMNHVKKTLANLAEVCPDYDPEHGHSLEGFVWFQGWNDMVDGGVYPQRGQPGGYDAYSENMAHFIRDVRNDLGNPELPFVIGVLGVGGPVDLYGPSQQRYKGIHQNFRNAMAAPAKLPEFQDNVAAVLTETYWDQELTALKARDGQIRQEIRKLRDDGQLTREEAGAALEKSRKEAFTARELKLLEIGISNQEYHYLGSAKILSEIGQAFAEALLGLSKSR